jgi:hypothetical protein
LSVDPATKTLLVSSGYTFAECRSQLDAHGLVLKGTPETDTITIGGAIAVGAHGGGRYQKPLSGYALEIWIRDHQGEERRLQNDQAGYPRFCAAAVSLGLLGTIVKVKLQCFKPEENRKVTATTVSEYSGKGIETADERTHSFMFAPYMQRMVRSDETPTDDSPNCCACCFTGLRCMTAIPCVTTTIDCCLRCCPCLACALSQSLVCPGTCVFDKLDTFLPTPANFAFTVEYAFDISVAGQVFDELKVVIAENAKQCQYVTFRFWCRYIGKVDENIVLAQSAGADKVAYEFTFSRNQKGVENFLDSIIAVFQKFWGRPHLGKTIRTKDVAYAGKVYGRTGGGLPFLSFDQIRRLYDPQGVFLNSALQEFVTEATNEAKKAKDTRRP